MNSNISEFLEYQLYPALYDRIDQAFPDMDFRLIGGYWRSRKHIDGSSSGSGSKDQTFIHYNRKHLIKDQARPAISLIDFQMSRTGKSFIDVVKDFAELCGIELPGYDSEEYRAYEEAQRRREEANEIFKAALWAGTPGADEVLNYLRNTRKWSDDDIREAELGYIDEAVRGKLSDEAEFSDPSLGKEYRLTIPYRNGGRIFGFKCRTIKEGVTPKYKNTKGLSKSKGLFGMNIGKGTDLVMVEGELDALHAKVKGVMAVAATSGGEATDQQIEDAIRRGVSRFTLLFDGDSRGKDFTASTIDKIEPKGKEVYVAQLPEEYKDTDAFLSSHTIEEWEYIVRTALPSYVWKFNAIIDKYISLQDKQEQTLTMKQREDFFADVDNIINSRYIKPQNREIIYRLLSEYSDSLLFNMDEIRVYLDNNFSKKTNKLKKEEALEAVGKINNLLQEGSLDEAMNVMKDISQRFERTSKETAFAKVMCPSSPQEIASFLSEVKEGIPTDYEFNDGKHKVRLTLNPGLTFICGYRGHGKTSFLNNIAINDAKRNIRENTGKAVLYFSYEVDKRRLMLDMLNTFINDPSLGKDSTGNAKYTPLSCITSFFRGKNPYMNETQRKNFDMKKDIFIKDYLSSGALTIIEENYKVEDLLKAIKFYISTRAVSIVCIDYAQLIYSEDYSRLRTEEIKRIVNDIKDFANKEGIPFVLAAQFNREVDSPASVDTKNIGEGGDFERIADTCIGLFNLKELHPLPKSAQEEKAAKKKLTDLNVATYMPDESLSPIEGKIFVRLMKRRFGYYPIDTVMDWEGSTKYIKPNIKEETAFFLPPTQNKLPF